MGLSKRNLTILILAFITVFLDMMNAALIVPILPFLVKELNSTAFQEALLFSMYSVMQLISLLIMGPGSDLYGRKLFLLLSLFGSCFGSLFQAMSADMWSLIFWRAMTGLFAGSQILVQAVIADITTPADRNSYLSRLDACISVAYIVGPAIGGVLAQVNNRFPMYVAGVVSGLAMIVALIFLKESNPKVLKRWEERKNRTKGVNTESKTAVPETKPLKKPRIRVKITPIMILCFIFEFCIRWTLNAYDSRYGIFLTDKWNISSATYSTIVVFQSVLCGVLHAFAYPFLAKFISIPRLASIGMTIEFVSYILMGAINNLYGNVAACFLLWVGYCCASPTSASIITTTVDIEHQGTVLSWNNFCNASSLIICPLVLAAIYPRNKEAIYYASSITAFVAACIMGYVSMWPNAKTIGKEYSPEVLKAMESSITETELKVAKVEKALDAQSTAPKNGDLTDNSLQSVKRDEVVPVMTSVESSAIVSTPEENSVKSDSHSTATI